MKSSEIRKKFLEFFVSKGHAVIPSASIIPENDPTVLFTTAGMQPLVPFLLGEKHPQGVRLVNSQKCIRTGDIDEVGDNRHLTFFEMLGNWSLGDYFKEDSIAWSFELLTDKKWFGFDPRRIYVTVFEGDDDAPRDYQAIKLWQKQFAAAGVEAEVGERIFPLPKKSNWWGPAGQTGPCGPDTEIFYDTLGLSDPKEHAPSFAYPATACASEERFFSDSDRVEKSIAGCNPDCDCGRYVEIWNNVFMQYLKQEDGTYSPLEQMNVDTGMGLERMTMILQGASTVFETDLFMPLVDKIKELSGNKYYADPVEGEGHEPKATGWACAEVDNGTVDKTPMRQDMVNQHVRVVADHVKAAVMIIGDERGVTPSNIDQGYIVRRLIRRAMRSARRLCIEGRFVAEIAKPVIEMYRDAYPELERNRDRILSALTAEEEKFSKTLEKGLVEASKLRGRLVGAREVSGKDAFYLYETFGFPRELTEEVMCMNVNDAEWEKMFKEHQEKSRAGAAEKFAGGLADHSLMSTKYHTATHLLHAALRQVLGGHVEQRGSNITSERMRFDFSHEEKMTPEQRAEAEKIVNEQIERDLPVSFSMMSVEDAKQLGAIGLFEDKYASLGDQVKVYSVGDDERGFFSREICGGPHVERTGELGKFRIKKEESSSAGVRRIKAVLE